MGTISVMFCAFQMKRFSYMKHAFIIQFLTPLFLVSCHAGSQHGQEDISADSISTDLSEACDVMSEQDKGLDSTVIQSHIVSFYKAYMSDSLSWEEQDSLTRQMLTPEAYEKVKRATRATDCNQILRAQDYSDYGRSTVKCRHLGADWYEVSYQFAPNEEPVFIPLRVESGASRHPRIDYIVPEWGGRQWGDAMFDVPKVEIERDKDVLTFVSTFYKRYVYSYATNSLTLDADRKELCKRFCTQALRDSIEQARVNHGIDDGIDGFDAIVNDYDFDALWFAELDFSAIDNHQVRVSFHDYHHLVVTVSGKKGSFLINSIRAQ